MPEHEKRAHALLSASSAHRWLKCTPSAVLESQFPDTTSEAAKEGTLAHELAELKIRLLIKDITKRTYNARVKKLKEQNLWSDEMEGCTQKYADIINDIMLSYSIAPSVQIEQKLNLAKIIPEGFGTADCVIMCGDDLHVIDYKHGKGVSVSAENNPQMMLYALGVIYKYVLIYSFKRIVLHIVQPRIENYSTWELSADELYKFSKEVERIAAIAYAGEGEFNPGEEQCRFCRARQTCRARAEKNVELAFATEKKPDLLTDAEIGEYLEKGATVAEWLKGLQEYALGQCLAGKEIPGWKAVEGRSVRDWSDMEAAFAKIKESGIPEDMLWERKAKTLAQVEKIMGKKDFEDVCGEFVIKPPGKPTLVPASDKREAVKGTPSANEAFKED